jgi:geranylgeranyl pyrophosphate synthase
LNISDGKGLLRVENDSFVKVDPMAEIESQTTPQILGFHCYNQEEKKGLDKELERLMLKISELRLYEKIKYVLHSKGKLLRSDLVLLSGQCVGGSVDSLQRLCIAIEMLHAATLVHDDILDKDVIRRNTLSVQAKWGIKDAILVGDALASLSINLASSYGEKVISEMAQTCLLLSDGEYMDVQTAIAEISEKVYFEKIRKKSASLFKAATKCGAIAGKGTEEEVTFLATFGENYGYAYQIRDDLSDITPFESDLPRDVSEFRVSLPIVHLYENSTKEDRKLIERLASSEETSPSRQRSLKELLVCFDSHGSFRYCNDKIEYYVNRAIDEASKLKETAYRGYLIDMANSLRQQ